MTVCFVVHLALLLFVFHSCESADPQAIKKEGPECPGIIVPPFADSEEFEEEEEEPPLARPHAPSSTPSQDEHEFIPYKILFLLDETVSQETKPKFARIFDKVNERLSRIVRARKVIDVRVEEKRWRGGNCSVCERDKIEFPEEFVIRNPRCVNVSNVTSGPTSQRVNELNTHNYTLVVRVFVLWEGAGANMANHSCASSTIAYAHRCPLADALNGVDHGTIMYCKNIDNRTEEEVDATSLHETIHILATTLVVHFPSKKECPKVTDCENRIWKNDTRLVTNNDGRQVEKYVYLATTDELRDAARAYFDCQRAEGVELNMEWNEITGRFDPDWSHWSEQLFPDELMSPRSYDSSRLSNLTLSVLAAHKDWYRVDMSKAEPLFHKIKDGCHQLEKGCQAVMIDRRGMEQPTFFQPFCDPAEEPGRAITSHCSSDHKVQLRCYRLGISNNNCSMLIASSRSYDHPECANTTAYKDELASGIGASYGADTICVTLTSTPRWPYFTTPVCVQYECVRTERKLVLKFQPKAELGSMCFVNCSEDESNRIAAGPKDASCGDATRIAVICPDYSTICDPPTTTTSTTTTTVSTPKHGESSRSDTPVVSTLPPAGASRTIRPIALDIVWCMFVGTALSINAVICRFA